MSDVIVVQQPYHGARYIIAYKGGSLNGMSYPSAAAAQADLDDIRASLSPASPPAEALPSQTSGAEAGWRSVSNVPEDEWLIVATTGGWVGEAMVLDGAWKWASGHVFHSDIVPLKWMPLPEHPEVAKETAACLTDAEQKLQAARCACRGADDYCPCQNTPDATTIRYRKGA